MKLKDTLFEVRVNKRNSDVDKNELKTFIERNCAVALKKILNGHKFFRGEKSNKSVFLINPKASQRVSRDRANFYNLYMDINPNWKGFPSRSWSVIFSNARNPADGYSDGFPYVVLPLGNPTVAASKTSDFLDSPIDFLGNHGTIDSFACMLPGAFHKVYNLPDDTKDAKLFSAAVDKMVRDVTEAAKQEAWGEELCGTLMNALLHRCARKGKDVKKEFFNIVTPQTTHTILKKFSDIAASSSGFRDGSNYEGYRELWTEGKCLMVKETIIDTLWPKQKDRDSE